MMVSYVCYGYILSLVAQSARFMMMGQADSATWLSDVMTSAMLQRCEMRNL